MQSALQGHLTNYAVIQSSSWAYNPNCSAGEWFPRVKKKIHSAGITSTFRYLGSTDRLEDDVYNRLARAYEIIIEAASSELGELFDWCILSPSFCLDHLLLEYWNKESRVDYLAVEGLIWKTKIQGFERLFWSSWMRMACWKIGLQTCKQRRIKPILMSRHSKRKFNDWTD